MTNKTLLDHLKNSEWPMIEKMVDENFKCELHWIGVTMDKDDFLTFVQATVEDQPDVADFEIINEIQFGNVVVTKLLRQLDTREEPPNIELIIASSVASTVA